MYCDGSRFAGLKKEIQPQEKLNNTEGKYILDPKSEN